MGNYTAATMIAFLVAAGTAFSSYLAQFALGCLIAMPVSRLLRRWPSRPRLALAAVLGAAACGCLLPLGPFGALPIAWAALSAGLGCEAILAFLCANLLFNMLVPFSDPTFIWMTGYARLILAVAAGGLAGGLTLFARLRVGGGRATTTVGSAADRGGLLRSGGPALGSGAFGPAAVGRYLLAAIAKAWPFLVAGALVETAFRRYGLGALVGFLFTDPHTAFLPGFFAGRNIVNPLFLLATRMIMALTDLSALAALSLILRPKGLLCYLAYFTAVIVILGLSAFF